MEEAEEQVAVEERRLCSEAGNVARREKCMGGCISNSEERYFQDLHTLKMIAVVHHRHVKMAGAVRIWKRGTSASAPCTP